MGAQLLRGLPRRWGCEERREVAEEGESEEACLEEAEVRPWSRVGVWAWVTLPEVAGEEWKGAPGRGWGLESCHGVASGWSWPELACDWRSWEAGPPALWDLLKTVGTRHLPPAPASLLRSQELFPSPQGMQGQGQGPWECWACLRPGWPSA